MDMDQDGVQSRVEELGRMHHCNGTDIVTRCDVFPNTSQRVTAQKTLTRIVAAVRTQSRRDSCCTVSD
jgi:hypothetical protein